MESKKACKPKPDPAPTGCELGARRTVEGRNGGTLTPHPPGSNGGVRRGPDLSLRRHLIRGLLLEHLARADMSLEDLKARCRKSHRRLILHAMTEYIGEGRSRSGRCSCGRQPTAPAEEAGKGQVNADLLAFLQARSGWYWDSPKPPTKVGSFVWPSSWRTAWDSPRWNP